MTSSIAPRLLFPPNSFLNWITSVVGLRFARSGDDGLRRGGGAMASELFTLLVVLLLPAAALSPERGVPWPS